MNPAGKVRCNMVAQIKSCDGYWQVPARRFDSGQGEFTEGHELPDKWKVPKEMVGRRLSQEEAKRLLAKFAHQ